MTRPGAGPEGDALKRAVRDFVREMQRRVAGDQRGVGTFSDHLLGGVIAQLEQLESDVAWEASLARLGGTLEQMQHGLARLQGIAHRRERGRLVGHAERRSESDVRGAADLSCFDMAMSQGVTECLRWKDLPLFKSVYDLGIYSMLLWELKPRTVFEVGSGSGASAIWMADIAAAQGIDTHVYSLDIDRPDIRHAGVSFVEGDSNTITEAFDERMLTSAPHPWLVIEDAHVAVPGVLRWFDRFLERGDYLVVEDSAGKQDDIQQFLESALGLYTVDTRYTDFFGRNVTCAQDSILVRG